MFFRTFLVLGALFQLIALNGCVGSMLQTLANISAGPAARVGSLNPTVTKFHRSVYWEAEADAANYVAPEAIATFSRAFHRADSQTEKLVEINVKDVVYNDDIDRAEVKVQIKYFRAPNYVVRTRNQTELWTYRPMRGGWLLSDPDYGGDLMNERENLAQASGDDS